MIISSLIRPMVSSICSKGVSIIAAMLSSVPRMISMYSAIVRRSFVRGRLPTLSPTGRTAQGGIDKHSGHLPGALTADRSGMKKPAGAPPA
ncbi:hypothetical protein [Nonomuraea typhae]|uniref:hypothetical protein n=1 Tax=Nonomuraea typhae TaxID=2603600 RepID=UPI0015E1FC70|nr:hypothetical protein [Nonomuraea typhae]